MRFAERFGPLALSHTKRYTTANPAVMLISNIRENGKQIGALPDGEMQFHSDQCYQEKPAMASMLYAIEVPSTGGNTLFANAYIAYETLPEDIKRRIDGRKALHAYDYDNASMKRGTQIKDGVPHFAHPVFRTHPATGRKALYVNRLMTIGIEGLPEAESDELLNFLFAHQENPAFVYEHVWRVNDLLMWDNRCALHARTDFQQRTPADAPGHCAGRAADVSRRRLRRLLQCVPFDLDFVVFTAMRTAHVERGEAGARAVLTWRPAVNSGIDRVSGFRTRKCEAFQPQPPEAQRVPGNLHKTVVTFSSNPEPGTFRWPLRGTLAGARRF